MSEEIDHFMKWCAKMRGDSMNKLTTVTLDRDTMKELNKVKYENDFKSLNETIKFLLNKKKQK